MDLNTLEIPETITVHLEFKGEKLYSDGAIDKPLTIELYSPASDEAIDYKRKVQRKTMVKLKKSRTNSIDMTPEEIEEQGVERLVAFTAGVHNIELDGKKIGKSNISEVYSDPRFGWINDQLNEKLGSWDDFLE